MTNEHQPKKRVFFRPPDNWDEMTPEQRHEWSLQLVRKIKAASAGETEAKQPEPEE